MLEKVENKQEVIVSVLTQLMENLSTIKDTAVDFRHISETRENFDKKLQKMVDG